MANKLYRILDSLYNTPHLVTESALRPIVDYLQVRSNQGLPRFEVIVPDEPDDAGEDDEPEVFEGIGEICIDGVLTYKPVYGMCGPTGVSYQSILSKASELVGAGCHTIILTHSSPGGQASHCFTTAQELRAMCDENDIRLISYIDEMSCSAALALGIVADEVYIHPSASTGSIGCVIALIDDSKAMANAGLKPIYIASSPGKTGLNEDGSFSESFLEDVQSEVTRLGNQFAAHVSQYTGIPLDDIAAMDARIFNAEDAVTAGLANAVMDHKQFAAYIGSTNKGAPTNA